MSLESVKRNGHNLSLFCCETEGKYDIPVLRPLEPEKQPGRLDWVSFNNANADRERRDHGVHFFIDDYLFERCWHDPSRYAMMVREFRAALTPDFSLYTDYPKAVQIYNHWRKHWLGAYWQSLGIPVIPSVCWSDEDSYDWCFDGEPKHAVVAVSSVGTQKSGRTRELFMNGYNEMLKRLEPERILFFGDTPGGCKGNIEQYDAFYKAVSSRRKTPRHREG